MANVLQPTYLLLLTSCQISKAVAVYYKNTMKDKKAAFRMCIERLFFENNKCTKCAHLSRFVQESLSTESEFTDHNIVVSH